MFNDFQYQSTHTHTHPFNGPFSGTTRVSRYQKGKIDLDLLKQETVNGSGISWAICKSAPSSRQITMPAPHHSVFYRPDALPAAQLTASKHWRPISVKWKNIWQNTEIFSTFQSWLIRASGRQVMQSLSVNAFRFPYLVIHMVFFKFTDNTLYFYVLFTFNAATAFWSLVNKRTCYSMLWSKTSHGWWYLCNVKGKL